MKAYPVELRERIVEAVDQQSSTVAEIAEIFAVTERDVYKLLRQQRERGPVAPLPHGGGARAKLSAVQQGQVLALVARRPDATLAELQQQIYTRLRVDVSVGTVWALLNSLGVTRKKRPGGHGKPIRRRGRPSARSKRGGRGDA